MTTNKNDAAALTDEQVDGETMFSLLDNGRSVAVRTFAYVLVAVGCLALTSCESPTGPTSVVTADTFATSPPPFPDTAVTADPAGSAGSAVFDVSPDSKSVTAVPGATTFTVSSLVGWSVEDDAAWLIATKTDGSTISVSYEANSGTSSRTANIKAVGTGGLEETVTVTQAPATAAVFDVSPDSRSVTDASGTTTFTVSSLVGWSVEDDAAWLTATKIDESTISVSYEANASTSSRTANILATAAGGSLDSSVGKATEGMHVIEETVTVTQAAATAAGFDVSPDSKSVSSTSGTTTFTVSSTLGWSVEDDAAWLIATKTDGSTIGVSYEANASTSSRTANIKAFGTGVEETVTVTQAAASPQAIMVSGAPVLLTSKDETSQLTAMAFYSNATKQDVTASATWETSNPGVASVSSGGLVTAVFPGTTKIKATFQGKSNSVLITVTVTQAIMVSGTPVLLTSKDETSQLTAMAFYFNGTKQDVTASATWETSNPGVASVSKGGLVTASVLPGTTKIKATFQGKSNSVLITVTVTQAAVFDVSPNSKSVGYTSGTTTFTVSSQVGWSVEDDAAWLTATKTDGSTISVSYQMNLSANSRTANIKAFGTGGVEETVTMTQSCVIVFLETMHPCGS